jgi:hypothetical protein
MRPVSDLPVRFKSGEVLGPLAARVILNALDALRDIADHGQSDYEYARARANLALNTIRVTLKRGYY